MKMVAMWVLSVAALGAGAQARKPTVAAKFPEPGEPTVLIDTTEGRLVCRVYAKEAPVTSGRFLQLAATGFYDGSPMAGITDGVSGEGKGGGDAGAEYPAEKTPTLTTARAGLLGMAVKSGSTSAARFAILEHADNEYKGRMTPFALCDEASVVKVAAISHELLVAGNRPAVPVMINKVLVVKEGEAMPALTPNGPAVVLQYPPVPGAEVASPEPTGPTAVIETSMGTLTCKLFNETKVATANFIGLATGTKDWHSPVTKALMHGKPFYNGLHFSRVIPDFMVQQADLPGDRTGDGSIGFEFANEIVPGLSFDRPGRLAYANAGPATNSSEFFITENPQHRLDGNYTIFGQCDDESVKVVAAIARVPRDADNRPLTPVTLKRVVIAK